MESEKAAIRLRLTIGLTATVSSCRIAENPIVDISDRFLLYRLAGMLLARLAFIFICSTSDNDGMQRDHCACWKGMKSRMSLYDKWHLIRIVLSSTWNSHRCVPLKMTNQPNVLCIHSISAFCAAQIALADSICSQYFMVSYWDIIAWQWQLPHWLDTQCRRE